MHEAIEVIARDPSLYSIAGRIKHGSTYATYGAKYFKLFRCSRDYFRASFDRLFAYWHSG